MVNFKSLYLSLDKEQRNLFARDVGVSEGYLRLVAQGHKTPSLKVAKKISLETGGMVSIDSLAQSIKNEL